MGRENDARMACWAWVMVVCTRNFQQTRFGIAKRRGNGGWRLRRTDAVSVSEVRLLGLRTGLNVFHLSRQ